MKDPSTSVLRNRFRPLAICHVGNNQCRAPLISCINIRINSQIYGPGPVQRGAWWKFGIQFSSQEIPTLEERQSRRKVAALSRLLLLMISAFTGAARAEQPFST
jgi:hypothetical protein